MQRMKRRPLQAKITMATKWMTPLRSPPMAPRKRRPVQALSPQPAPTSLHLRKEARNVVSTVPFTPPVGPRLAAALVQGVPPSPVHTNTPVMDITTPTPDIPDTTTPIPPTSTLRITHIVPPTTVGAVLHRDHTVNLRRHCIIRAQASPVRVEKGAVTPLACSRMKRLAITAEPIQALAAPVV